MHLLIFSNLSLSRRTRTRCVRPIVPHVLCRKAGGQCDKLSTVVGRTKLTTLATVDGPWRQNSKVQSLEKVLEGNTRGFEITEYTA